jgi:hypothetical protein
MEIPPAISAVGAGGKTDVKDAMIRSGVSLTLGIIGFWYPVWYDWKLDTPDTRLGMVLLWTLPVILIYGIQAGHSLHRAFRTMWAGRRFGSALAFLSLGIVCWAPLLWMAILVIGGMLQFLFLIVRALVAV